MTQDDVYREPQVRTRKLHEVVERASEIYAERSVVWNDLLEWSWHPTETGALSLRHNSGGIPKDDIPCSRSYLGRHDRMNGRVVFVFALPGMGKSTISSSYPDAIDADYGSWRRVYGYSREDMDPQSYIRQLEIFLDMIGRAVCARALRAPGGGPIVVFSNNLDLMPYANRLKYRAIVVIPHERFVPKWLAALREREKGKPARDEGAYGNFAEKAAARWEKWITDWKWAGHRNGIPVYPLHSWMTVPFLEEWAFPDAHLMPSHEQGTGPKSGTESRK